MLNNIELLAKIENKLDLILTPVGGAAVLWEAMRYSTLGGGKRIRPLLTIAGGQLSSAAMDTLISVGAAIELIHCYSLIHDDLPVMDNDDLRRGLPTCHIKYNEAIAVLAGDALQALAFEVLSADSLDVLVATKLKIINQVATAAGASGMGGGQAIDLISSGKNLDLAQLRQMHDMKTGCLIRAAILSGYLCGSKFDNNIYQCLTNVADKLGLLFQIIDDILDATSDAITLGKTANKDIIQDKATYIKVLGLDGALNAADILYQEILALLGGIANSSHLIELTTSIYNRNN